MVNNTGRGRKTILNPTTERRIGHQAFLTIVSSTSRTSGKPVYVETVEVTAIFQRLHWKGVIYTYENKFNIFGSHDHHIV